MTRLRATALLSMAAVAALAASSAEARVVERVYVGGPYYAPPPRVYYVPAPPPAYVYGPPPAVVYAPPPVVYGAPPVAYAPPPPVAYSEPAAAPGGLTCREYQATATVGGRMQESYGTACLQPDGSWRMVR